MLVIISLLFLNILISHNNVTHYIKENSFTQNISISSEIPHREQWLDNSNFDDQTSWIDIEEGDPSDVDAFISQGYGNYLIIGDSGAKRIDEPLNNGDWTDFNNPKFPISPDTNGSDSRGLFVTHEWDEGVDQTRNTPSIHWKSNVSMPVNMSDYIITSAFLEVIFNATVTAKGSNPLQPHINGIERPGDYTEGFNPPADTQFGIGDFATFYVLISDVENNNVFQVALNQTTDLGQDSPEVNNYTDTPLEVIPEEVLITYLSSILENDNFNFTITLGIDIYCEDNEYNVDIDTWNSLIIRSFNLTFTYKKKINQFSSISWQQTGEDISGENIQITNARLNFEYKINQTWPLISSPNSDIRVLINNKQYVETIKLSRATDSFQEAYPGNIDVTSLISKDINISLTIQVYLADEFGLSEDILISIDNVFFEISYIEIISDIFSEPVIFRMLVIVASLISLTIGGYLFAYQRVLKYPKPVRKVRKYRRTLRKNNPSVEIIGQKRAFANEYKRELHATSSLLRGKPSEKITRVEDISKVEFKKASESKKTQKGNNSF